MQKCVRKRIACAPPKLVYKRAILGQLKKKTFDSIKQREIFSKRILVLLKYRDRSLRTGGKWSLLVMSKREKRIERG
jgi:hypothetical protein